ncbi:MAG TPA: hypothetical protein VJ852_12985 [Gemmatimonadaceae bacterium]|nr:hypothetical protein [Gemmatimonadaceae bacterium]
MRHVLLGSLIAIAACSTPTSVDSGLLLVTSRSHSVTLTNHASDPVSYLIGTPDYFALYDPGPCRLPEGCNKSLAPKESVTIPNDQIGGYHLGQTTAIVIHWRGLGGMPVDGPERLEIALR